MRRKDDADRRALAQHGVHHEDATQFPDALFDAHQAEPRAWRPGPVKADTIVREGQMLARVSHPNVMAIYGAQEVDGQVGIWGEFLHGRTLARMGYCASICPQRKAPS